FFSAQDLGEELTPPDQRQTPGQGGGAGRMRGGDGRGIDHQLDAFGNFAGRGDLDPFAFERGAHRAGEGVILPADLEADLGEVYRERTDAHPAHPDAMDAAHFTFEERWRGRGSHCLMRWKAGWPGGARVNLFPRVEARSG